MAGAIVAVVAAVGGWGAAAAIVLSIASAAYAMISVKNAQTSQQQERKQMLRSGAAACNVVYGRNRSAGVLVFAEEDTDDNLYLVATHASHPLHKVEHYKLNDEFIIEIDNSLWDYRTYKDGAVTADQELLKTPSWRDDMVGKGFAWYWMKLKFDQTAFPQGVPNINVEKWGWEIVDPRSNQAGWSDNPVICILHYLKHYMHYQDDELIIESFINAANVCDEWVTLPDDAGQEKRYRIGAEFELSENPADVLDKMKATCGGEWIKVGGRLGITVAAYYGPAVIEITEDDIIGDVELQPEVERQDAINTIRGKFNDASQDYIETDYPQVSVKSYVDEDGETIINDMDLSFVQSPWQCQRLAHIAIMRNRFGMQLSLPCNLRGFKAVPGSIIKVNLAGLGIDALEFRVLDWEFSIDNGVVLIVRRELADMYDDAIGKPMEVPPFISGNGKPTAPTDLRFDIDVTNDGVSGRVYWQNKAAQLAYTIVKIKSGETLVQAIQVPSPAESVALIGMSAGTYTIEAISVTVAGRHSPLTSLNVTLALPIAPTHADIDASSEVISIAPHIGDDTKLSINTIFEFWFNATDDFGTAHKLGQGKVLAKQGLAPNTQYWFWVYTINPLGKSAAALAFSTKTTLISGDLVEHIDAQIEDKVGQATSELMKDLQSLTDIRSITEDLDAQITAELLAQGLSEIEAVQASKRQARVMKSVKTLSTDQQSLVQEVKTLYASFDDYKAINQEKDRVFIGYPLKQDGSPGVATTPEEAELFGEKWIVGKGLADSVKLVGIITDDGRELTVTQYFSALETETGELKARAFLGVNSEGRVTGIGITSDTDGSTIFQSINLIADAVAISNPDKPDESLLYFDTIKRQLVVKGRMILGDGYEVNSVEDIKAQDGFNGAGFYRLISSTGSWPGDSSANGLFKTAFGRYPVTDDVLTFFKSDNSASSTKRCSQANAGSNAVWANAALLLHGDMIALGSISGDRFIANTEISAPYINGGHLNIGGGKAVITKEGKATFENAVVKGHIEADTGYFKGPISAAQIKGAFINIIPYEVAQIYESYNNGQIVNTSTIQYKWDKVLNKKIVLTLPGVVAGSSNDTQFTLKREVYTGGSVIYSDQRVSTNPSFSHSASLLDKNVMIDISNRSGPFYIRVYVLSSSPVMINTTHAQAQSMAFVIPS